MPIKYKKQPFSFVKRLLFWIPHITFIPKSCYERIIKAVIEHDKRAITKILPLRGNPPIVCKPQKDDLMIGRKKRPFRKRKRPLL